MTHPLNPTVLTVEGVSRAYGQRRAVIEASLTLEAGKITCLLGPSGSGKSTLLRLIAGLEPVDAGVIRAGDEVLSRPGHTTAPERRGTGLVFQDYALFPHLTVLDNVRFGLTALPRGEQRARAMAALDRVGLADRARDWPHALSGGEQQRVALARSLVREPAAILLDEPFSGLDAHLKAGVRDELTAALRAAGAAVLIVTHDPGEAMMMADRLVLMDGGRVIQSGEPADCHDRPASVAAARLLGEINAAYSNEDEKGLRERVTDEMFGYFDDDLTANVRKGVVDRVSDVKLLQGDLSEAWTEEGFDYATVAMRFSLINALYERSSGKVVDGSATVPQEVSEYWTFVRRRGGPWKLSAIQQAA